MGRLDGKVAIITGSNSGVGAATAKLFAKEGAKVVISARRLPQLEEVAAEIRAEGGEVLIVQTDVSKNEDAINLVEKTVETFKGEEFNLGELKRQLAASNSVNMLFEKSKLDAMEKRPLLPLNIGQLGLIGGSGLINGYIDCDSPHVIKGRIIKQVRTRENEEMNTLTETRVNKMIFNILTPNGVKKLA